MEYDKVLEERRSYRAFDAVTIDEDMVREIAYAASRAASCSNNQPWRFVFVRKEDILDRVKGTLSPGNNWGERASMIVAVVSKPDLDCQIEGRDYNLLDTGMAMAHLMLKAVDIGLAVHPIAGFDQVEAKKVLNIPDDYQILPLIIVGKRSDDMTILTKDWQIQNEKKRSERKPLEEIMFLDRFEDQ